MTPHAFRAASELVSQGIGARCFPAAVVEVGGRAGPRWREAFGHLTYEPDAPACSEGTLFDLASLTKVIATTTLAMRLVESGALGLQDRVGTRLSSWTGSDREDVAIGDLLEHASGLTAYLPLYVDHHGRSEFERVIGQLPLEYRPRARSLYSDLGFVLLGFILEDAGSAPFADQCTAIVEAIAGDDLMFAPSHLWPAGIAPTEVDPWRGRLLVGDVHDENTWALGGAAGHAGLFGTAEAVGTFARWILDTLHGGARWVRPETLRRFVVRSEVPGSSRALGWDTMLPTSSCGGHMSGQAIGHTGFTGTSLWVDPVQDAYVVFLTNRVHPSRNSEGILEVRRRLHDAVMQVLADAAS